MASLRVIAALEWGLSVICALRRMHLVRRALLRETPLTATATRLATDHGFWERDLSASLLFITHCGGKPPRLTLRLPLDHAGSLNRPSSLTNNFAWSVNRPKVHSPPTRLAVIPNFQKSLIPVVNVRFVLVSNFTSGGYSMPLMEDLLERPYDQAITSKYTAMNGLIYLGAGTLVLIWPGMVQTIFRDAAFVGNEAALIRVMGMTVMVIGWLYLFGGLSGGRRIVAASVLDRVVLVPLVLVPLAIAGVFPHFLLAFAVLDPTLGIGAWLLLSRSDRPGVHSTAGTP
jgi:hypothetical protein